ncbi:acyl-[acyl-carrier-protein] thioesterase [Lactobacillus sp. PV037]|uniref:acyl-[acyl-carrier-protein] thioesterase n=1 Tax=unclassified Lactobacillus TaxID=2620435 RepID=UPI00223FCD3F|nr:MULTISPECIES: acyl-ACP thioesterase domain-containing protein [unclassified Lactobacillus]QNQ81888.1 acyl-[acyl-carrier-protein] thioesterase [Lactobacillus sp. PV012]QNQ84074.1 acyl-[acyl-carrier-protein] thioesterase [Lactobacillus sp. PV037]
MDTFDLEKTISFSNCDEQGRLKLTALVDYMMETSNTQLNLKRAGVEDLGEKGLGWVVLDYDFNIKSLPKADEKVIFSTQASGYNRFFVYRDFSVKNMKGETLLNVKSQWIMFDLKKRKMVPPDKDIIDRFDGLEEKTVRFKRARSLKEVSTKDTYQVKYYDLDTNHHVTNSKYFEWLIDSLERDFLNTHLPSHLNITFKREIYDDEVVEIEKFIDREKLETHHEIKVGDEVAALAKISWKNLK